MEGGGRSTIGGDGATAVAAGGGRSSGMGEGEEDQRELLSHSGTPFFAIVFEEKCLESLLASCYFSLSLGGEVKTKRSSVYSWLAGWATLS